MGELASRTNHLTGLRAVAGGSKVAQRSDELVLAESAGTVQGPRCCEELAPLDVALRAPQRRGQARLGRRPLLVFSHGREVTRVVVWEQPR